MLKSISGPAHTLVSAALDLARDEGITIWQCLYTRPDDLDLLREVGCLDRPIVQYHWTNSDAWRDFNEFLDALTSKRRKEIRRERRRVADQGIRIEVRHGGEFNESDDSLWPHIHRHYLTTFERYGTPAAFTEEFFREVATGLGRRFLVFIAFRDARGGGGERPVASASRACVSPSPTFSGANAAPSTTISRPKLQAAPFAPCRASKIEPSRFSASPTSSCGSATFVSIACPATGR